MICVWNLNSNELRFSVHFIYVYHRLYLSLSTNLTLVYLYRLITVRGRPWEVLSMHLRGNLIMTVKSFYSRLWFQHSNQYFLVGIDSYGKVFVPHRNKWAWKTANSADQIYILIPIKRPSRKLSTESERFRSSKFAIFVLLTRRHESYRNSILKDGYKSRRWNPKMRTFNGKPTRRTNLWHAVYYAILTWFQLLRRWIKSPSIRAVLIRAVWCCLSFRVLKMTTLIF